MTIVLQDVLKDKRRIAMGGHVRPDGDCVGSCMGLYLYLKEQFPQIHTDVYLEEVPEAYRMISGTDEVKTQIPEEETYDLFICLDCGDVKRLGFQSRCLRRPVKHCALTTISAMRHLRITIISSRMRVLRQS